MFCRSGRGADREGHFAHDLHPSSGDPTAEELAAHKQKAQGLSATVMTVRTTEPHIPRRERALRFLHPILFRSGEISEMCGMPTPHVLTACFPGPAGRWTPHVNVLTANLWLLLWQGADLDRFKAVAKERQSRNVAPHVARDSSAFAEFLEEGKAKGGAKL